LDDSARWLRDLSKGLVIKKLTQQSSQIHSYDLFYALKKVYHYIDIKLADNY